MDGWSAADLLHSAAKEVTCAVKKQRDAVTRA